MKYLKHLSLFILVSTYMFWEYFPQGYFYKGIALSFLLIGIDYFKDNKTFISYLWLSLSINNIIDEFLFDPTKLGINEIIFCMMIPLLWIFKTKRNARKIYSTTE